VEDDQRVRAEALVLLALGVEAAEEGAHAVETHIRRERAGREAVGDDDRAVGADETLARKRVLRILGDRRPARTRPPTARGADADGGAEIGARRDRLAAPRAEPTRDDGGIGGPAPQRPHRRQAERLGPVVVIDEDLDRRAERKPGGAAPDAGGLRVAHRAGAVADAHLEARRSAAGHPGPCLRRRQVRKRDRGAVEPRRERGRIRLRGETQEQEELRPRNQLPVSGTEDLDELGAGLSVDCPPEGVDQAERVDQGSGRLRVDRATGRRLVDGAAGVDETRSKRAEATPCGLLAAAGTRVPDRRHPLGEHRDPAFDPRVEAGRRLDELRRPAREARRSGLVRTRGRREYGRGSGGDGEALREQEGGYHRIAYRRPARRRKAARNRCSCLLDADG
jgi:hypothetical protein